MWSGEGGEGYRTVAWASLNGDTEVKKIETVTKGSRITVTECEYNYVIGGLTRKDTKEG